MAPIKTRNPEFPPRTTSHERILPHFFPFPAVVALARGAVLIGVLAVLFWGVRTCITAPAEKPMAVAEKLIEAGREAGLTLINKGFSSNHGGVALIVQKDEKWPIW